MNTTNGVQILEKNIPIHPIITLVCVLSFIIILYKRLYSNNNPKQKTILPPSPRKLPIIGNLHQLSSLPHRSLQSLSNRYGDLMLLHLGSKPTLVVSSAKGAEEVMKTHDITFANRPFNKVAYLAFYNGRDIAFGKYGEHWRKMKAICISNLLSNNKVSSFRPIREDEVGAMVDSIQTQLTTTTTPPVVDLSDILQKLLNVLTTRVVFGRQDGLGNVNKLLEDLTCVAAQMVAFSIGDFVPWLSWIDHLTGRIRKVSESAKSVDFYLHSIVQEHIDRGEAKNEADLVDAMLQVMNTSDANLDFEGVKALLLDLVIAGIDATWTSLEWTMSELLINPEVMKKLQEEVRKSVKVGDTMICEEDLKDMKYLKAVIKEGLRLHPPGPLLLLREASEDVKVRNYDIAAGTTVIINAWAIQRDPTNWVDPEEFKPERFLNSSVDVKGQDFELVPFGSGRRGCPGMSFAIAEAELIIANLVGLFDWQLPDDVDANSFMDETFAAAMRRRDSLCAIPKPYFN